MNLCELNPAGYTTTLAEASFKTRSRVVASWRGEFIAARFCGIAKKYGWGACRRATPACKPQKTRAPLLACALSLRMNWIQ